MQNLHVDLFSPTPFPTSIGPWGKLFAEYYNCTRTELTNEITFWRHEFKKGKNICEIGAGTGYLSKHMVDIDANFYLVDPEEECLTLLRKNIRNSNSTNYTILKERFETSNLSNLDYVYFPYDSLPMMTDPYQRLQLFSFVSQSLKKGGLFSVHVSTKKWADDDIQYHSQIRSNIVTTEGGIQLRGTRLCRAVSTNEYLKYISIQDLDSSKMEIYTARTSIIDPSELEFYASQSNLKLVAKYSDFHRSTKDFENSYDLIMTFKKGK